MLRFRSPLCLNKNYTTNIVWSLRTFYHTNSTVFSRYGENYYPSQSELPHSPQQQPQKTVTPRTTKSYLEFSKTPQKKSSSESSKLTDGNTKEGRVKKELSSSSKVVSSSSDSKSKKVVKSSSTKKEEVKTKKGEGKTKKEEVKPKRAEVKTKKDEGRKESKSKSSSKKEVLKDKKKEKEREKEKERDREYGRREYERREKYDDRYSFRNSYTSMYESRSLRDLERIDQRGPVVLREKKPIKIFSSLSPMEYASEQKQHKMNLKTILHRQHETDTHHIRISSEAEFPEPYTDYSQTPFDEKVTKIIQNTYPQMVPPFSYTWPIILNERNFVGVGDFTEQEKFLSFLLPAFRVLHQKLEVEKKETTVVVVHPRADTLIRIAQEAGKFKEALDYRSIVLTPLHFKQNAQIKVQLVHGIPRHLYQLIVFQGQVKSVDYLVIDDLDQLLELGHESELVSIIGKFAPQVPQLVAFTSTWSPLVQQFINYQFAKSVRFQYISKELYSYNNLVIHSFQMCADADRNECLIALLKSLQGKVIVFCESISVVKLLDKILSIASINHTLLNCSNLIDAYSINTGQNMIITTDAAAKLRKKTKILDGVDVIVHYQLPKDVEHYLYRTQLAKDKEIRSIALITTKDQQFSQELSDYLKTQLKEVPTEISNVLYGSKR